MATLFLVFWITLLCVHALLFVGALMQPLRRRAAGSAGEAALRAVSAIVPVRGDRGDLGPCLASLATIDYPNIELVICVGDPDDPALPTVRKVVGNATVPARCLVGRVPGLKNDKLQLVANAYQKSKFPLVLMTDDNMIWSAALLRDLVGRLDGETGLVSGVVTATGADTPWGRVEQAMINGYFNRLMLAGDLLGVSHATGKILLFRRADLDAAGGMAALNTGICEDATLRESLEARGLRAVLSPLAADHPVPDKSLHDVWHRQLRWFRCRKAHGGFIFWLEPLISMSALVAWSLLWAFFDRNVEMWQPLLAGVALWVGLEAVYLRLKRLPLDPWLLPAVLVREAVFPVLWLQCLTRVTIDWRGNDFSMTTGETRVSAKDR
ncbi:MAG: glycosyltransferase [Bauldia litoralis]